MLRSTVEKLLPRSNWSIYKLSRMAATRALELADGKRKLVDLTTDKLTSIALQEIAEGKIELKEAVGNAPAGNEKAEEETEE
ncbi:MAG: DNA-directed RNA polymerase subunit omega [Candidatus Omnitrophica bacterium]|nr:DNA-directed RNA polymerase subunit omega [Candidatus Omnitrophota bacterium]MBU4334170.1 DNA-directed RNA polymerase subunit omega [Candidatus Omnitrophota bacterium]